MKVKEFKNIIYGQLNQRGPSALVGDNNILSIVQLALNDIYTYNGKSWTFMLNKIDITPEMLDISTTITTTVPVIRLVNIEDKYNPVKKIKLVNLDKTLSDTEVYFKPNDKVIKVYNNNKGYYIFYMGTFNPLTSLEDEIPLPDIFLSALYNLVMNYILMPYGQYADNKTSATYQTATNQLASLAQFDSFQLGEVKPLIT